MKPLYLIMVVVSISSYYPVHAQETKQFFYNQYWELTTKDSSVYYRIAEFDTLEYKFTGLVKDYYSDGQLQMEGIYKDGIKNGPFMFYYPSGQVESLGEFKNNLRHGTWRYFYANGSVSKEVTFNGSDFFVKSFYDVDGKLLLTNGTGEWYYRYAWYGMPHEIIVKGIFSDGKKEGEWQCKYANNEFLYKETFRIGKLKKGFLTYPDGSKKTEYSEELPNKFLPHYKHQVTESFIYVKSLTYRDYPFLDFLPSPFKFTNLNSDSVIVNGDVYLVVERPAQPIGGMQVFYEFIARNLRYPAEARKRGIQGKVFVEFIINENGKISEARTIKGIGGGCDEEAVRVILLSPPWRPGEQRGKPVRQRMVLPVSFKIG